MADVIADRLAHPISAGRLISAARDAAAPIDFLQPAKIGPSAIRQLLAVMKEERHERWLRDVFYRSGLSAMLVNPPTGLIEERAVADLYQALFQRLPPAAASRIASKAGTYAGRNIVANHVPKVAQFFLKHLPARYAGPLLLRAIHRVAWTFAGSGLTTIETRPGLALEIKDNLIAMPGCVWQVQMFETLFRHLVSPKVQVKHTACCLDGASSCRFEFMLDQG